MKLSKDHLAVLKAIQADAIANPEAHSGEYPNGIVVTKLAEVTGLSVNQLHPEPPKGKMPDKPTGILEELMEEGLIGLWADEVDGEERIGAYLTDEGDRFQVSQ